MTTTARTAEIDFYRDCDIRIADAWTEYYTVSDKLDNVAQQLNKALENRKGEHWLYKIGGVNWNQNEKSIPVLEAKLAELRPAAETLRTAAIALDKELYTGWSRFFLVKHIHSNTHCSSFRMTTRVGWLPNVSGLTEVEAVGEYGETLCTICYPSAPTELTTKQADPTICTGTRDHKAPSRTGYYSGNWATCTCGQRVTLTSAGNLRKHKKEAK